MEWDKSLRTRGGAPSWALSQYPPLSPLFDLSLVWGCIHVSFHTELLTSMAVSSILNKVTTLTWSLFSRNGSDKPEKYTKMTPLITWNPFLSFSCWWFTKSRHSCSVAINEYCPQPLSIAGERKIGWHFNLNYLHPYLLSLMLKISEISESYLWARGATHSSGTHLGPLLPQCRSSRTGDAGIHL